MRFHWHRENHSIQRLGWLRAAVLGANDGIVSTASLIMGVASAHAPYQGILVSGVAAMVAGSMSMAAGEYVSVSSQADSEKAALVQEKAELEADYDSEHHELTRIYVKRGLQHPLAAEVATQLMRHDSLDAHARDELGISDLSAARPLQAAAASACSFAVGAALPLGMAAISPVGEIMPWVAIASLASLALLGALAARAGGAPVLAGSMRVTYWSVMAMAVTTGIGMFFDISA